MHVATHLAPMPNGDMSIHVETKNHAKILTSEDDCAGAALKVRFVISTAAARRGDRITYHSTKEGRVDGAKLGHDERR